MTEEEEALIEQMANAIGNCSEMLNGHGGEGDGGVRPEPFA